MNRRSFFGQMMREDEAFSRGLRSSSMPLITPPTKDNWTFFRGMACGFYIGMSLAVILFWMAVWLK